MDKIIKKDIVNGVEYKYNGIGGGGSITDNNVIYISQTDYDNLTPAEKADATKNYVIIGEGGIPVPTDINAEDVDFDNTGTGMQSDNVQDAIEEVFQSVSNGKTLIAAAITDKGVSTAASDSFQTMATNIGLIQTESLSDKMISSAVSNGLNGNFYLSSYGGTTYSLEFKDSTIKKGISISNGWGGSNSGDTLYIYYDDNNNCVCNHFSGGLDFGRYGSALYVDGETDKIYFGYYTGSRWQSGFYYDIANDDFVITAETPLSSSTTHTFNNVSFTDITFTPNKSIAGTGALLYITPVVS